MEIEIRKPYVQYESEALIFTEESLTQQSMAKMCDINQIMKRYEKTGLMDHVNTYAGQYGEFITEGDYHDHLNLVLGAQQMFETLPSDIRAKFDNNPGEFLAFVDNPENHAEMVELGLVEGQQPPGEQLGPEGTAAPPETPEAPAAPAESTT